ncbi:hypothetical protein SAMN05421780_104176 [Flexibacter flexilis DSM 6793]|uniref:Uncharacterized protein n=1 Tax=Flexibacter flexilis DSM 6793 TaxID=927664 RepID=A0A1I1I2D4_9BACT|nr:hypothetical protein [Flexibacter flexilis]SFC30251.1 hypothetical protein SAMN05421780_104176 [Flexibacter flexilis DSM 6793]
MKENLKYIVKLSSVALFSFLKINILATFSTVVVAIMGFILLTKNIDAGHSAHTSAIPFLILTFFARPVGSILWYLVCIGSPFLFFALGNKYILQKLSHKIITEKSENLINPLLDRILEKFKAKQPNVLRTAGDFSLEKLKLIQDIKTDKAENKWLRKIIVFGLQKVQLDDVDFNQENQSFTNIIKVKTIQSLENISQPSRKLIWMLIAIQWIILVFIWLTKY